MTSTEEQHERIQEALDFHDDTSPEVNQEFGLIRWGGYSGGFTITLRAKYTDGDDVYSVGYGVQIETGLTRDQAAMTLGESIMHLNSVD